MKKGTLITLIIIIAVILFAIYIETRPSPEISEELAKCIGENAIVYSQTGCHFCEIQKDMFGDNYKFIPDFNCNSDNWETCQKLGITGTPTWEINGEFYRGIKTIEVLQQLTGC